MTDPAPYFDAKVFLCGQPNNFVVDSGNSEDDFSVILVTQMGQEAMEGLRFLAPLPLAGTVICGYSDTFSTILNCYIT